MVHLRLNDPDTSRNELINYITALPQYPDHEEARQRLCQLAAQVKPVMKKHGLQINSLEEFEWNREFAGRNWNAGENVELVLRRQDGSFAPLQWVLMVFCHELAHNKHMNHVPSLHGKLERELKQDCKDLQARSYYGDGFWSAGQRLFDNTVIAGAGMNQLEGLPQYSCGGAYRRPTKRKRGRAKAGVKRKRRDFQGPSLHTGAQTAPNTKGGRRNTRDLPGQGSRVDSLNFIPKASASSKSYKDDPNSTFRKRATSQQARELRADAAMRRLGLGRFKVEQEVKDGDEEKKDQKPQPGPSGALDGFLDRAPRHVKQEAGKIPPLEGRSGNGESGTESETETEDEAAADPNDGFIILDTNDADDTDDDETEPEPELEAEAASKSGSEHRAPQRPSAAGARVDSKEKAATTAGETRASGETEAQRRERARLYRQHEREHGSGVRPKTTSQDWEEWASGLGPSSFAAAEGSRNAVRTASEAAPAATAARRPSSGPAKVGQRQAAIATPAQSVSAQAAAAPTPVRHTAAPRPIKVKAEEAITVLDDSDDDNTDAHSGVTSQNKAAAPAFPLPSGSTTTGDVAVAPTAAPEQWACRICTLLNSASDLRCGACDTSRGATVLGD